MARLTLTNRGSGTHNTGASSFTLSPGSNCTAGALVALCVAADNSSSGGATNDFTTVTDTLGNTWTKVRSPVFDNGAASAGVQGAIYTTDQKNGTLQTSTTITVAFGSSPAAKTWTLTEIDPGTGRTASVRTSGDKSAGATGTALTTGASASVLKDECILAAFFIEAGTTQTLSAADTDTTNGSWSTNQYAEIGSTTSGSVIVSQGKVVTADGTQTYDVTLGISSDYHGSYIIVQQDPIKLTADAGSIAITGTAANFSVRLNAESASVPIGGTAATVGRKLTTSASAGSVAIGGTDATLTYVPASGATLTADPGAVAITGTAATVGRKLTAVADSGSVPVTGTAAAIKENRLVSAQAGSVAITGTAAGTRENHLVSAQAGSVPIGGTATSLKRVHEVSAQSGSVPITGTAATLTYDQAGSTTLVANPGAVQLLGSNATFLYAGGVVEVAAPAPAYSASSSETTTGPSASSSSSPIYGVSSIEVD